MKLVKYVGNADDNNTGAISFPDGRPNLQLGGRGEMTGEEIARSSSFGLVLEIVDDGGLEDLTKPDLEKRAKKEGIDSEGMTKTELVSAIRATLADVPAEPEPQALGGTSVGTAGGPTGTSTGGTSTTATSTT